MKISEATGDLALAGCLLSSEEVDWLCVGCIKSPNLCIITSDPNNIQSFAGYYCLMTSEVCPVRELTKVLRPWFLIGYHLFFKLMLYLICSLLWRGRTLKYEGKGTNFRMVELAIMPQKKSNLSYVSKTANAWEFQNQTMEVGLIRIKIIQVSWHLQKMLSNACLLLWKKSISESMVKPIICFLGMIWPNLLIFLLKA